jgi:hypothetical protein
MEGDTLSLILPDLAVEDPETRVKEVDNEEG